MVKLFRAYTVRENYKDRDVVIVEWFCLERTHPVAPYESLIANHGELSEADLENASGLIDNFLTQSEANELVNYMNHKFNFEVKVEEVNTPFEDGRRIPNFSAPGNGTDDGEYLDLSKNVGYDLSVPISGFCDLSEPPNLISSLR